MMVYPRNERISNKSERRTYYRGCAASMGEDTSSLTGVAVPS